MMERGRISARGASPYFKSRVTTKQPDMSNYSIDGRRKNHYIHRLVANTFISNPKGFDQVNHIDGNKSNNSVSNLEWVTERQNRDHAVKTDLMKFGEDAPNNKLTEEQVIEILAIASKNPKVNRLRLSKKYNVADTCICRIISGKRWRRTYEKFHSKEAIEEGVSYKRN